MPDNGLPFARPGKIADRDARDGDSGTGQRRDQVGVLVDDPRERGADVPAAEEADPDVTHDRHDPSL